MFTGIVEELGHVVALDAGADSARLTVAGPLVTSDAVHGASIAVNGVCLTVVEHDAERFTVDVMAETLDRSSLGALRAGDRGQPRAGHGGLEPVRRPHRPGPRRRHRHDPRAGRPATGGRSCGSACPQRARPLRRREGVDHRRRRQPHGRPPSTTRTFSVSLIPTTLALTTLGHKGVGDTVNLEVDVLAKYVERLLTTKETSA